MTELSTILKEFTPIALKEMDRVKLMDRTDTKFIFKYDQLHELLDQLKEDYSILEVNGNRLSRYESLYFDTKNFDLYHCHHRGKASRFKIKATEKYA